MKNRKVLITGGNKGIGLATTKEFLDQGFKVVVMARDFSKFKFSKDKNVQQFEFDLANLKDIPPVAKEIGDIDVLVNNAAVFKALNYETYSEKDKMETLKVNIEAPVILIQELVTGMIKRGGGRIVNVASIAGQIGHSDLWYGISKAGLINVTKTFARALASKGIVINAVAPGPVETNMLKHIPKQRKAQLKKTAYSGRYARPEEVAKTIFWLATSAPSYINGFCIDINNGAFPR